MKPVTTGRVRRMIAGELHDMNQRTIASSYTANVPDVPKQNMANVELRESPIVSADRDHHNSYRADSYSVLHDRNKQLPSAARLWSNLKVCHLHRVS
ncbi:MAG TPA: hypothetical protein VJZ68_00645 [Nitrososphaera sp.]|nr:hypothetical protein [Nitrososphaera sp.]